MKFMIFLVFNSHENLQVALDWCKQLWGYLSLLEYQRENLVLFFFLFICYIFEFLNSLSLSLSLSLNCKLFRRFYCCVFLYLVGLDQNYHGLSPAIRFAMRYAREKMKALIKDSYRQLIQSTSPMLNRDER